MVSCVAVHGPRAVPEVVRLERGHLFLNLTRLADRNKTLTRKRGKPIKNK